MNMERYERFAFSFQDHVFFVEFGLKLAEGLNVPLDEVKEIKYEVTEDSPPAPPEWPDLSAMAESSEPQPVEMDFPAAPQTQQPEELPAVFHQKKWIEEPKAVAPSDVNLSFLLDIPLEVSIELGRAKLKISQLLKIHEHSVVGLKSLADDPVEILVNNKLIAKGEVVVEAGKYGIRVTEVLSREDRLKTLR